VPRFFQFAVRFAFIAAIASLSAGTFPAFAQGQSSAGVAKQAAVLAVDIPAPNTTVSNGQFVDIGGWTAGTRVDIYLDGAAGVGDGIGSTEVDESRPDVAMVTHPGLADSGFDVSWFPMNLTAGPHTIYVYALIDGNWNVQARPIVGEGNVVTYPDFDRGRDEPTPADTGSTDSGSSAAS
jgi:hypothetical protein